MNHIVLDLEATCWEGSINRANMETIEIGAVKLNQQYEVVDEFAQFIRPVVEPQLSAFCQQLTTIRQEDVDPAETFVPVFEQFLKWIGPEPFVWYSWGDYDQRQLQKDCERLGYAWPAVLNNHINLKNQFAKLQGMSRSPGMTAALTMLGLTLDGQLHRGIDDARNIAKIAQKLLPQLPFTTR